MTIIRHSIRFNPVEFTKMLECAAPVGSSLAINGTSAPYLPEIAAEGSIPVLIVGSQNLALDGLRMLLQRSNFCVKQTAINISDIVEFGTLRPRLIIVMLDFLDQSGETVEVIRSLRLRFDQACIAVLLGQFEQGTLMPLAQIGANAILNRNIDCKTLISALHVALAGYAVLSPFTEKELHTVLHRNEGEAAKPEGLSQREAEIIGCIAEGHANKIIARRFSLSEATVKIHVRSILRKVEARNRTQAALWALNKGFGASAPNRLTRA